VKLDEKIFKANGFWGQQVKIFCGEGFPPTSTPSQAVTDQAGQDSS
jgi:hypothetical protein